jgi:hypothetical protein
MIGNPAPVGSVSVAQSVVDGIKNQINSAAHGKLTIKQLDIGAGLQVQSGTKCCHPDDEVPPTPFKQYTGSAGLTIGVDVPITPYNGRVDGSVTIPGLGSGYAEGSVRLGPEITVTGGGTVSISGDDSACSCLKANGQASADVGVGGECTGEATARIATDFGGLFKNSSGIGLGAKLSGSITGTTHLGVSGDYQTPCQPTGLSNVQGQIGGLTIHGEITAALTAKGKLAEILAKYLPKLVLPSVTLTHDWVIFKPISV